MIRVAQNGLPKQILEAREINQPQAVQFRIRIQLLCGDCAYSANRQRFAAIYRRIITYHRDAIAAVDRVISRPRPRAVQPAAPAICNVGFHGEMTFDSFQLPVSKGCQGAVFVCVCRVSAGSAIF